MLELAVLGLLKERSMHGYQLSKRLTGTLGGFWRVSYGSLYPTLKRLERDGAVEQVSADPTLTRRKTVYRVTEKGEKLFLKLLEEVGTDTSTEDTRFRIRLAFFRYLAPDSRIRVLERRRASLEERLSAITASLTDVVDSEDDPYTRSLIQHGRDTTEQDIEWLDGLIAAERRQLTTTGGTSRRSSLRRKERTT